MTPHPQPDWHALTNFALSLANASAKVILPHFRQNTPIEVKAAAVWDPVTEGDKAGERIIRQMIEANYPDHGIIGEEYGVKDGRSGFTWVLDPVDGTRAFVIGFPSWATLIGLYYEGKPVIGVMNQPFVGELFYGNPDGAWTNHRGVVSPIRCRQGIKLADAKIGTTAPELYRTPDDQAGLQALRAKAKLTRYGGDAYYFSLVAAGHLDIAMDAGLQIYDIAALIPIIRGAGGAVGSWNDTDPSQGGNIITAGSQALLDEAIATMRGQI
jgi:myo-inositol-1(or 4)-monophosphatase